MLALTILVLLYVILKSIRLPDWLALVAAVGAAIAARPYLPVFAIESRLEIIIAIVAGLVSLPYWLGPILVYATNRSSASPRFDAYDPARHVVPPTTVVALRESETALLAAGFAKVGDFFQTGFVQNMTTRVGLLEKTSTRQQAIIVGMYMNSEPTKLIAHYVEIMATYTDGRTLLVNNSPMIPAYAPVAGKTLEQFPGVSDPRRLARLHERLLARDAKVPVQEIDRGPDAAAFLTQALIKEMEQQIPLGYLRREDDAYRPTVLGAVLMTWTQLPPMTWIRRSRMRRRGDALIRSLGVTEPDAMRTNVPRIQTKIAWPAVGVFLVIMVYAAGADTIPSFTGEPARPKPLTVPSGFMVPPDFPGAVKALETLTGAVAEQLTVIDSLGFPVKANGATLGVAADRADGLLLVAQPLFLEQGFYLFRHEPNYGIGGAPDEIALVPMRDQFEVIRLVGTNGVNIDLLNANVIAWLRELERDAPFVLTGIGYDHVEGRFLQPVGARADSIAKRLNGFCPDIVDQGTGSIRELANEIGRLNTFFCWWD
jgi:hypothetical protein